MSDTTEFYERMRHLYPAVNDVDMLPRSWHKDKTLQHLSLSFNNLRVHYKGTGKGGKEAAAVRTHAPIPAACGVYYFEVKVVSKGRDGHIGVGLSGATVSLSRLPGWEKNSFGYHGDDGCAFQSSGTGTQYGPTFTTGDIIGCCWNMVENCVFYTKNGVNLGVAFRDVPSVLYPTVGLQSAGEIVEANFGQHAFMFAISDYVAECRRRLVGQLLLGVSDNSEPASVARRAENDAALRHLVLDYISAQGYSETALALSRLTNEPLADSVQSMRNRQRISKLICSGKVSHAIRLTQRLYPEVLERNAEVLFHLRCRQFVEILNGHDRIDPQFHASSTHAAASKRSQLNGNGTHSTSSKCTSASDAAPAESGSGGAQFAYVDDVPSDVDAECSGDEHEDEDAEDDQFADASSSFEPPTSESGGPPTQRTATSTLESAGSSSEPDDELEDVEMRDGNVSANGDAPASIVEKRRCTTKQKQNGVSSGSRYLSDADSAALIEFGRQLYAQLLALYGVGITSPVTPNGLFTAPAPYPIATALSSNSVATCDPLSSCTANQPTSIIAAPAAVNWWDQAPPSSSVLTAQANLSSLTLLSALSSLSGQIVAASASVSGAASAAAGNPLVLVGLSAGAPIAIPHPLPLTGVSLPLGHSANAPTIPLAYGLSAASASANTVQPPQLTTNGTSNSEPLDAVRVTRFERERARLIDMFTQFGCGQHESCTESMQHARESVATELNSAILASRARSAEKRTAVDSAEYRPALDTLLGHLRKAARQMATAGIASAGVLELADFVNPT